jgi:hypothetical protein
VSEPQTYVGLRADVAGRVLTGTIERDADCGHRVLISPAGVPLADASDQVLCVECALAVISEGTVVVFPTVEQLEEIADLRGES